jgi:anti-anti-sigma regulatory factor
MTLRIEKSSQATAAALRLIGRVQTEHLDELNRLIENNEPDITLDLSEVNLVDIDVVRFLGACQAKGVRLTGCSPYIRDWIAMELEREH